MNTIVPSLRKELPRSSVETLLGRIAISFAATLVVALAAHVSIPLPFTPIPLTLQPLAVLGVGLALGPVAGFFTMVAYLTEGALGFPVFSPAGVGGVAQLLGPTGGFLMAYPFVAALVGALTRRSSATGKTAFIVASLACASAISLLFVFGAGWLLFLTHISLRNACATAVLPFLPGEFVKVLIAAGVYSTLKRPAHV